MKLENILNAVKNQKENEIDTKKGVQSSGIAFHLIEVLKAVKETGKNVCTLNSKMFEVDFLSKQSVYNALKSLGIAQSIEGKKTNYPCKFFVKENSLKASSEVERVNIWNLQEIK